MHVWSVGVSVFLHASYENQPDSMRIIYMAFFDGLTLCLGTIVTCLCGCNAECMTFPQTKLFSLSFFSSRVFVCASVIVSFRWNTRTFI